MEEIGVFKINDDDDDSWLPVRSTCTRSYSLSSAPPPDSFCCSHIVHLFLTLCDSSCTGSKCQIVPDSNCVCWYTDAYTDSLLSPHYLSDLCTPAMVHAHLRSSVTLVYPPDENQDDRSAWILLRLVCCLECTPSASA